MPAWAPEGAVIKLSLKTRNLPIEQWQVVLPNTLHSIVFFFLYSAASLTKMTCSKGSSSKNGFSEDDCIEFRKQFHDIKSTVKKLIEEINSLKLELKTANNNLKVNKKENENLKTNFKSGSLQNR